ncbi:Homeobox protein yox1 [Oleoguttula sp. CCFEE 5521]
MPQDAAQPAAAATVGSTSPAMDDLPSGRQKRKRTSPEDQIALEAAYSRDPKPDKTARQELVKLVAMGEKEVQIWFQNRRQSSRRKNRPLLPHEVAQYHAARAGHLGEHAAYREPDANPESDDSNATIADEGMHPVCRDTATGQHRDLVGGSNFESPMEGSLPSAASQPLRRTSSMSQLPSSSFVAATTSNVGYFSNKRRESAMHQHDDGSSLIASRMSIPSSERQLKQSSSIVRLAMDADGAARITTKDGSSPSPPRPLQDAAQTTPDVSQGPAPAALDLRSSTNSSQSLRRSMSGRSRDSRAWEFWCDKDSRTELEDKSAVDDSGSASNAIGLMRASSGRSILGPLTGKRISGLHRTSSAKRARLDQAHSGLVRSSTSGGRLQQGRHEAASIRAPKLRYSLSNAQIIIPGNDSDKENWSPDRAVTAASDDLTKPVNKGVLSEKRGAANAARSGRKQSPLKGRLRRTGDDENADPDADPELAAFMRSGRRSRSISGDEELDCVQGLLSLSQGAWR